MILHVENITKSFGRNKILKGISFEMQSGVMNGIVGENGSGKSTLMKIIVGQWKADSGKVKVNGRIGYCPQKALIFPQLTVDEHFKYFSAAYNLETKTWKKQRNFLAEQFKFRKYLEYKVEDLSGGTQQKLNLSLSLLHQPKLLILDEPYSGFDWETYQRLWDFTDQLTGKGCGILVVTHLLSEKERFEKIYNLKNGKLE